MCVIFIAFNIKHDYNENSFFVRVNKVSISEATVRVVLCLVHRIAQSYINSVCLNTHNQEV